MEAALLFFIKTPKWIYPLLIFLIFLGLKSKHSKEISVKQLFIMPAAFIAWSGFSLVNRVADHYALLLIYIGVAVISAYIEFFLAKKIALEIHKSKATLVVPGSGYKMLALLMIIFTVKFIFGFTYGAFPQLTSSVLPIDIGFSGFISGYFLGKNLRFYTTYRSEPCLQAMTKKH